MVKILYILLLASLYGLQFVSLQDTITQRCSVCLKCNDICYENWDLFRDVPAKFDPNYCPDCIKMCAALCNITIDDYYLNIPTTTPTPTTISMEEDCYLCGEICDWDWTKYEKARQMQGETYCTDCVNTCNDYDIFDVPLTDQTKTKTTVQVGEVEYSNEDNEYANK